MKRVRGLDGLRGVAVAAVVIYHLYPDAVPGGFLGVTVFFVLSGFFIVSLLLTEGSRTHRIAMGEFWKRRFRRLLPAGMLGLTVAVITALWVGDVAQLKTLPGDVGAALAYILNWRFVVQGIAYGAKYEQPSVVQHYWSLAIEEQFYIGISLLALVLAVTKARRWTWALTFVVIGSGSLALTFALGSSDQTGIYFNTGTRALELIIGALLAVIVWKRKESGGLWFRSRWTSAIGLAAAAAIIWFFATTELQSTWLYRGGFGFVALLTAFVVLAVISDPVFARLFAWRPLIALGLISYGVYVYHWPLFILISSTTTPLDGLALTAVRLGATLAVAIPSYYFVENRIRHGLFEGRRWIALSAAVGAAAVIFVGALYVGSLANARAQVAVPDLGSSNTDFALDTAAPTPTRILMIGDSLMFDSLPSFEAQAAELGIEVSSVGGPSQTLVGNDFQWAARTAREVERFDPDVVVIDSCCGAREAFTTRAGVVVEPDTPEFYAAWNDAALEITKIAESHGALVFWVIPPPVDGKNSLFYGDLTGRMAVVRGEYEAIAAADPAVMMIDWSVLANPGGSYSDTMPDGLGGVVVVRAVDGFHFTPAGRVLQATTTLSQIIAAWNANGGRPPT